MSHPCPHFRCDERPQSAGHCDQQSACGDRPSFGCWRVCEKYAGVARELVKIDAEVPVVTADPAAAEVIARQTTPNDPCCGGENP